MNCSGIFWLAIFLLMAAHSIHASTSGESFTIKLNTLSLYTISSNMFNTFFTTSVSIGTPAQRFSLLVDTGSSQPWVYSADCGSAEVCDRPSKDRFNSSLSSTYSVGSSLFTNSYGAGLVEGGVGTDVWNVSVIDSAISWRALSRFTFGEVSKAYWKSSALASPSIAGFVGLTIPGTSNGTAVVPLFQYLTTNGLLLNNLFAFAPSAVTFGAYDASYSLNWVSVSPVASRRVPDYYWWVLPLQAILVDGQPVGPCSGNQSCVIMLDSGAGPFFLGSALGNVTIPTTYPCSQASQLPEITFVIDGEAYSFTGPDYSLDAQDTCWSQIVQDPPASSQLQSNKPDPNASLMLQLGAPWFQKFYTVHDAANLRVGIAQA